MQKIYIGKLKVQSTESRFGSKRESAVIYMEGGSGNEDGGCCIVFHHSHQSWDACLGFQIRRGMGIISGASRAPQGQVRSPTGAANQFGQDIEATIWARY